MNRLVQSPKAPTQNNKKEKTTEKPKATGTMKMVNGVAVMLPPDEDIAVEELTEKEIETSLESNQDVITVEVDSTEEEVQHVYDAGSEEKSNNLAAKIRVENEERAKKATIETAPKKVGDSIVAHSTSYDDIDLFAAKLQEKDEDESAG